MICASTLRHLVATHRTTTLLIAIVVSVLLNAMACL